MVGDFAGDELAGERGFEGALEESFQRTGTIDRVIAFAGNVLLGGVGQVEGDVAVSQAGAQAYVFGGNMTWLSKDTGMIAM